MAVIFLSAGVLAACTGPYDSYHASDTYYYPPDSPATYYGPYYGSYYAPDPYYYGYRQDRHYGGYSYPPDREFQD